ncbi:hypothetical protein LTR56_005414 [Elasticomyces elasticus]|nr:hypothetical protein LTR22_020645 [Elasticomyces elasticus]KAK3651905.1 hypothetical protein LTR56_005414 [Elasticomyces elasticus]KAK4927800.1 hypothetical protein LTR49_005426 [Elasticomyces elasticus]KAK5761471.1 hypothetical protein LTS12_008434 [Elasticomyces elasticus]
MTAANVNYVQPATLGGIEVVVASVAADVIAITGSEQQVAAWQLVMVLQLRLVIDRQPEETASGSVANDSGTTAASGD